MKYRADVHASAMEDRWGWCVRAREGGGEGMPPLPGW